MFGEQDKRWHGGESTRPPTNLALVQILRVDAICGLSLLLILSLAPRGFSPGTPVFPSPPTLPKNFQHPEMFQQVHKNSRVLRG